jgi:hypothetical protein
MGTVFKKTATKPRSAGAKTIIRTGERLDTVDVLVECLGLELMKRKPN